MQDTAGGQYGAPEKVSGDECGDNDQAMLRIAKKTRKTLRILRRTVIVLLPPTGLATILIPLVPFSRANIYMVAFLSFMIGNTAILVILFTLFRGVRGQRHSRALTISAQASSEKVSRESVQLQSSFAAPYSHYASQAEHDQPATNRSSGHARSRSGSRQSSNSNESEHTIPGSL
jgi:hypothetical protein